MNRILKLPFSVKLPLFLIGLYVSIAMLYIAQDIILPIIYGIILAIVISPSVDFMVKKKINRAIAISFVLIITSLILIALIILIISRASMLGEALPQLTDKFTQILDQFASWTSKHFDLRRGIVNAWITASKADLMSNSNTAIGLTVTTMGGILSAVFLTPVYVFMILLYQPHLVEFSNQLFGKGNDEKVNEVMTIINAIIKNYLVGLSFEFIILCVLNTVGLLLLGIEYAILLGIVGALLNIIPYLGGAIAVILYMLVALVTKSSEYVIYVAILYGFIQFIDNNYIVPKIVGSKVKLNALISLIAVILGAALWGIPGMFLSIPITAIIKLVFDRVESLKPLGFLLGDTDLKPIKINLKDILRKN